MSKKDSYWFRHDASAGRGLKMRKMSHIHSHWGKGVYWDVVEILRDQKEYKFESDESSLQLLADLIGCKNEIKFLTWFKDCLKIGLFKEDNNFFICPPLCNNMARWESSKSNGSKGGRPVKKPRLNLTNNLTNNLNETIIEQKSIEQDINNNKVADVLDYFKKQIGGNEGDSWRETFYMRLKYKKGCLSAIADAFKSDFILREHSPPKTLKKYKEHLLNWVNVQDRLNKFDKYKVKSDKSLSI